MIWKDRLEQYPHRYTLTNVSGSTYDFTKVTGEVTEAGTPVNAENLNKLIQRDGDDIKDTVTTFTEASTRANIATGEKTSTIFGKIKKWFTDLKPHAFNDLATALGTETDKAPTNKLLNDTAALKANTTDPTFIGKTTIKNRENSGLSFDFGTKELKLPTAAASQWSKFCTITFNRPSWNGISLEMSLNSAGFGNDGLGTVIFDLWQAGTTWEIPTLKGYCYTKDVHLGEMRFVFDATNSIVTLYYKDNYNNSIPTVTVKSIQKRSFSTTPLINEQPTIEWSTETVGAEPAAITSAGTLTFADYKKVICQDDISTVMPISSAAASNEKVLGEKVVYDEFATKSYADSIPAYDKIIRTQTEFEELIADPDWLDAESVALVGQFTYSVANNSGIKVPDTVKQIHGFNSAKITVTNFVFNSMTAKGGLWYDTRPTTLDYSIRDLEVDCTGISGGYGFYGCSNLTNCTATGTGTDCYGFRNCTNLTNCTATATGTGTVGYAFRACSNVTDCTGTGSGTTEGCGFSSCTNLTGCTGTGTGASGYGFDFISYASNCKDGGSTTNMWGGTNKNINVETCRKTPVTADNTALNT